LDQLREQVLTPWGLSHAICNPLCGMHLLFSEDMAASFARAVNEWMRRDAIGSIRVEEGQPATS
jgi:hypothetical protein